MIPPEVQDAHRRIHEGLDTECLQDQVESAGCVELDCAYYALDEPLP